VRKLLERVRGNRFARGVAVVAGGTAIGQLITLLALPVVTRLYSTADFGVLAVFTSFLLVLLSVASLRYELTISLAPDDRTAANVLVLCLALVLGVAVVAGLVVVAFGDQIVDATNTPQLAPYLFLLPLGLVGAGAYQALSYWAVRGHAFRLLARTKISQQVGLVTIQIGGGLVFAGPVGLLAGYVAGWTGGTSTLALDAWRRHREGLRSVTVAGMRAVAARYRSFPVYSTGSALLNNVGTFVPAVLLAAFYDASVAGLFALSQRVLAAPMLLLGRSVSQVYVGEASELIRQGDFGRLRQLYRDTARYGVLAATIPVAAFAIGGPLLFGTVFGEEWEEAGSYVQVMAPMLVAQFVAAPLAQTLNLFEQVRLQVAYDALRMVLATGSIVVASALGWSALGAVAAFSAAMFVSYCVNFVLNTATIRRAAASMIEAR
jgi:O-antigen/teichoic acid export membrane protein